MNSRILVLCLRLFFVSLALYCGQSFADNVAKLERVVVLPLQNDTNPEQYGNSGIFRDIFSRSFYNYTSILPIIDIPDISISNIFQFSGTNIENFSKGQKARYVIYGRYSMTGPAIDPIVRAELMVYDGISRTIVFDRTYSTTTGLEVFEEIDSMIADVLKSTLNIDARNIATIKFGNFMIEGATYRLYINGRLVASPSDTNFSLVLKIFPQINYQVELRQAEGGRTVLSENVSLPPNGSTNISYSGYGSVRINPIAMKYRAGNYSLYLDGSPVKEDSLVSNIPTVFTHSLLLTESLNKTNLTTNYMTNFDLLDSQTITVTPSLGQIPPFHVKLLTMDFDYATLMLQYFPFGSCFWIEAGTGFFEYSDNTGEYFYPLPQAEIGYYIIGNMENDFRAGAGFLFRYDMVFSPDATVTLKYTPEPWDIGFFITLELYFVTLQPEVFFYKDQNGNPQFAYTLAAGFHF